MGDANVPRGDERCAWCAVGNITYYDGTKYVPGQDYEPISDQRLTAENETATAEAEEEVANDDSLDDLFPDGLADTAIHDLPDMDPEQSTMPVGPESEDEDEDTAAMPKRLAPSPPAPRVAAPPAR
eukprot:Skav205002  [mRNA]  locus=scaffold3521:115480:119596:- [translate_table: standard]